MGSRTLTPQNGFNSCQSGAFSVTSPSFWNDDTENVGQNKISEVTPQSNGAIKRATKHTWAQGCIFNMSDVTVCFLII